jgi:hypothetical protein
VHAGGAGGLGLEPEAAVRPEVGVDVDDARGGARGRRAERRRGGCRGQRAERDRGGEERSLGHGTEV